MPPNDNNFRPGRPNRPNEPFRPGPGPGGYNPPPRPLPPPPAPPIVVHNVRRNFHGYGIYWTSGWYSHYHTAWRPVVLIDPIRWWNRPAWDDVYYWYNRPVGNTTIVVQQQPQPVIYNYGDNVTYVDDMVYVNGVPFVSADKYFDLAQNLAEQGAREPETVMVAEDVPAVEAEEEWFPLGTFAVLLKPDQEDSDTILQLAMSREGRIRGNEFDTKSDTVKELTGAVDHETQRVAFNVKGDTENVAECGLWNLTQESLPLLLHFGKDHTEVRTLVRLSEPDAEENANTSPAVGGAADEIHEGPALAP